MLQPARGLEPALVAQRDEQLVLCLVARRHGAAFARRHLLVRIERPDGRMAVRAERLALVLRTERLAAVLDHRDAVLLAEWEQLVVLRRVAEDVDGDDRLRPRRDRGLDRGRIEVERVGVDVGEDRRRPFVDRAVRRGDERIGRSDHLVPGTRHRRCACRDGGRQSRTRRRRNAAPQRHPRAAPRNAARSGRARASRSAEPRARAPRRARRSTVR